MVLEEGERGTLMKSHQYPDGVLLEDVGLWKLPEFLDHTT